MATLTCECCERENDVVALHVGDTVECPFCGAKHRIKDIEARLVTELQRAPADFDDSDVTPLEVPSPPKKKEHPP